MLAGDPAALRGCAVTQRLAARATEAAVEQLRGHSRAHASRALDAVDERRLRIAAELEPLGLRHALTASALADYASALESAQRRADDAAARRRWCDAERLEAEQGLRWLEARRAFLLGTAVVDSLEIVELESRIAATRERLDVLARSCAAAAEEYRAAELDRDLAAETAISRLASLPASDGLAQQLELLVAIDSVSARLTGGTTHGESQLLAAMAALDRAGEQALGMLWETLLVAGALGLGARLALAASRPLELVTLGAVAGLLAAFVLASIDADVRAPTPQVRPIRAPRGRTPRGLDEALVEAAEVDALGRVERTVVKISDVPGDDGVRRWRVVLPSTQDWSVGGDDHGAVNDLDANLALLLAPRRQTQYERAVLLAMHDAGIGPDDPVLLVGFSQGGILASHLAANRDAHHWAGVVAAGAPIDSMPIPTSVDVVAVEHLGDPVTRLERDLGLRRARSHHDAWTTIRTASSGSADGLPGIHSAVHYDATLRQHAVALADRHPRLAPFFSDDPDHDESTARYYTWRE